MSQRPLNPRRNKAFLIDSIIYVSLIVVPVVVAVALPPWIGGQAVVAGLVAGLFYIIFRDGFNGQSVGKRVFKIQVVHKGTRKPIGFWLAFCRGLLTSLPILGWVDFLRTVFTLNGQRLSDYFLGTELVATDELFDSLRSPGADAFLPRARQRAGNGLIYRLVAGGFFILAGSFAYIEGPSPRSRRIRAEADHMKSVALLLDGFQHICGHYPTTAQGLSALAKSLSQSNCDTPNPAALVDKVPVDELGQAYFYESDGKKFTLETNGGDPKESPRRMRLRFEPGWVDARAMDWQGTHDL